MDLKTMESKLLVKDEFWGFQNGEPGFSPDGEYVIYTAKRNFEDDIFVYHLKSGKTTNLTSTGVTESNPLWSGDGKYIYFSTNRTKPTFPTGGGSSHIYRFALDKIDTPFRTDEFDKLWEKDSTSKKDSTLSKKDTIAPITINTDRIWERFELISPAFGSQGSPYIIQKGDKTIVLYYSDHAMGTGALWKSRGGKLANQSNFAPSDKPIVLLINEQSLSDAEMTSAGFKALKLGTFLDRLVGRDPQLTKAVEVILKK